MSLLASTATLAVLVASPVPAEEEIGSVFEREFRGAEGTRTTGENRELRWGNAVYSEEAVRTEADESTELEFVDGTRLMVGQNSEVVLDSFVYDPSSGTGDAVVTFGKGVFRFVTGDMNKDGYTLNTPSATLAVRGTIFRLFIDAVNNVTLYVVEGAVEIIPCGGKPAVAAAGESALTPANCSGVSVRDGDYTADEFDDDDRRNTDSPERSIDNDNENGF
jgi:hypothetical protein